MLALNNYSLGVNPYLPTTMVDTEEQTAAVRLKRRRVDTGLPRSSYAQSLSKSTSAASESGKVLRQLLKNKRKEDGGDEDMSGAAAAAAAAAAAGLGLNQQQLQNGGEMGGGRGGSADFEGLEKFPKLVPDYDHQEGIGVGGVEGDSGSDLGDLDSSAFMSHDVSEKAAGDGSKAPSEENDLQAKRARVENIITNMQSSPISSSHSEGSSSTQTPSEVRRQKRKQCQPQPQRVQIYEPEPPKPKKREKRHLKQQLCDLRQQLDKLQQKYFELYDNYNSSSESEGSSNEVLDFSREGRSAQLPGDMAAAIPSQVLHPLHQASDDSSQLSSILKTELSLAITNVVERVVKKYSAVGGNHKQGGGASARGGGAPDKMAAGGPHRGGSGGGVEPLKPSSILAKLDMHPGYPFRSPANDAYEQTEALSLMVSGKEREKKAPLGLEPGRHHYEPPIPASLPTSVAIPNPSLHQMYPYPIFSLPETSSHPLEMNSYSTAAPTLPFSHSGLMDFSSLRNGTSPDLCHGGPPHEGLPLSLLRPECSDSGSPMMPGMSHDMDGGAHNSSLTSTLTPAHLKKAKLMFFYCRYPSSTVIKSHFPDIRFNRHNTAQLIKWFSNFREFYYIQMEKYARQSISDGTKQAEDLNISTDSEIFKVLNLHYNKSNEFKVPENFLVVAKKTQVEFFNAIRTGKDVDPSWKKSIYKVISKLDEPLPELFRSPDCLEELE